MLDRALNIYYPRYPTVATNKLTSYITTLDIRRLRTATAIRSMNSSSTTGITLLRFILAQIDIGILLNYKNDIECYTQEIMFKIDWIGSIFDSAMNKIIRKGIFLDPKHKAMEIIIPAKCIDPIKQLPLDKGWSKWSNVYPLRLVETDSNELTLHIYQDKIRYNKQPPTIMVYTLDVAALFLKRVNYLREVIAGRLPQMTVEDYIHKHVVVDALLNDLQTLWLRNQYVRALNKEIADVNIGDNRQYGMVGNQFIQIDIAVSQLADRCKQGNITPGTLLNSLPLSDMTLSEYVHKFNEETYISNARQSEWVEYLKDRTWLELSYLVHSFAKGRTYYNTFMAALSRDIPLWLNTRFWNNAPTVIRKSIENDAMRRLAWIRNEGGA